MRLAALSLSFLPFLLPVPIALAQPELVLKAACIGGYANTVTEVAVTVDGTISRQHYSSSSGKGKGWTVLDRDPVRLGRWLKSVDATKMTRVRTPTMMDRNPCKIGGSPACHIVRRKDNVDYYACAAQTVLREMMDFNEFTGKPRAAGSLEVLEQWRTAFLKSDVETLVNLHAPDALFIGGDSKSVLQGRDEVRGYYEKVFRSPPPHDDAYLQTTHMVLTDDILVVAGNTALPGVKKPVRVTFVIAKRGNEWLIVHFHTSAFPS